MIETVYIVRHGDRPWDLKTAPGAGDVKGNVFLTQHGEDQAEELAAFFDKEAIPVDLILCSPYHRALQTIQPLAKRRNLKIAVEPGFQEHAWGKGFHPVLKDGPTVVDPFDLDAEYKTSFVFPADVEPEHPEMTVRLTSAAEHVLKAVEVNPAYKDVKSVVISSHGGPIIALTRALTEDHVSEMAVYTCSTNKLVRTHPERILGGFKAEYLGRTDYLSSGAENGWKF